MSLLTEEVLRERIEGKKGKIKGQLNEVEEREERGGIYIRRRKTSTSSNESTIMLLVQSFDETKSIGLVSG